MTPVWIDETVEAFGRQMGLGHFALNERGAAGVIFENGVSFRLERTDDALIASVRMAAPASDEAVRKVRTESHPEMQAKDGGIVRAACLLCTGETVLALRIGEREISVVALEQAFDRLWERALELGRAIG